MQRNLLPTYIKAHVPLIAPLCAVDWPCTQNVILQIIGEQSFNLDLRGEREDLERGESSLSISSVQEAARRITQTMDCKNLSMTYMVAYSV